MEMRTPTCLLTKRFFHCQGEFLQVVQRVSGPDGHHQVQRRSFRYGIGVIMSMPVSGHAEFSAGLDQALIKMWSKTVKFPYGPFDPVPLDRAFQPSMDADPKPAGFTVVGQKYQCTRAGMQSESRSVYPLELCGLEQPAGAGERQQSRCGLLRHAGVLVTQYSQWPYADRRFLPLARRLASTMRPPRVLLRSRKPWVRFLFRLLGWYVLFIGLSFCYE